MLSLTEPESCAKTWLATDRMYAVACSRNPITLSTSTSTGSSASAPVAASAPVDLRDFFVFLVSAGNMRAAPSIQRWSFRVPSVEYHTSKQTKHYLQRVRIGILFGAIVLKKRGGEEKLGAFRGLPLSFRYLQSLSALRA